MNKCKVCGSTTVIRCVVFVDSHRAASYCMRCWSGAPVPADSFEGWEAVWNRGDTRLFTDLESAQLFIAKALM